MPMITTLATNTTLKHHQQKTPTLTSNKKANWIRVTEETEVAFQNTKLSIHEE